MSSHNRFRRRLSSPQSFLAVSHHASRLAVSPVTSRCESRGRGKRGKRGHPARPTRATLPASANRETLINGALMVSPATFYRASSVASPQLFTDPGNSGAHRITAANMARPRRSALIKPRYCSAPVRLPRVPVGSLSSSPAVSLVVFSARRCDMKKIKRDWSKTQVHYSPSVMEI